MNILVIGQNGREHALALTYAKSKFVNKVIMTPGNGLTDFGNEKIRNYPEVAMLDFEKIVKVCNIEKIDLVDVGQDEIIALGYVDKFERLGIKVFGPTKKAAEIEWSKDWSRSFMVKYNLPIPNFKSFNDTEKAVDYVSKLPDQLLFIKASGLAMGKGVIRTENKKQAREAILSMNKFGLSGETFLIEEGLVGEEFTIFAICDGDNYVMTKPAQDHKTIYDRDLGSNTGGMGSVAPTCAVTSKQIKEIEDKIIKPTLGGMKKEGRIYCGILYLSGIITKNGIKIIEFNARWGDPEAEVILPGIKTDYLEVVKAVLDKRLNKLKIKFDKKMRISVAGCAKGYPGDYSQVKERQIFGLEKAMKISGITIFGAGLKREDNNFYANGGRLFHLMAEGKDILDARKKAYNAMKLIYVEGDNLHFRSDIGWRDLKRLKNDN